MTRYAKTFLPIIIILVGITIAWQLMANSPKATRESITPQPPLISFIDVQPQSLSIPIKTQGTIKPRTQISLASQVSGRVVNTHSTFANGGFFQKNDILVQIDPQDYDLAITKAEAVVAGAKQQLAQAEAEYNQKLAEYKNMDISKISDFALRKPRYEEARANLKAAQAELELARLQRRRCDVRAPFDGRVVEKLVDVGQSVIPGGKIAELYAVDIAQIRLPITQTQAELLDASILSANNIANNAVDVTLTGNISGNQHTWLGQVVRTDATIDARNQLQYLIAQVDDPFNLHTPSNGPPLVMGLFVEAQVQGRQQHNIYKLPRVALRNANSVWLLDEALRLHIQPVQVLHRGEEYVYIKEGLQPNSRIVISPLEAVVEGMQLRVASAANDMAQE